jgi:DNA-binding winged helix-turn-helix (wHTH) protein/TolB-like protein
MEKRLNFAEFTLDLKNEELLRGGKPIPLQPQPMKVLTLLARRAGEIVPREELHAALWGADTHVDFDQGLNWCIRRIREALDDDVRQPRFVQTIPRKGYRFLAEAIAPVPRAHGRGRWLAAAAIVALACLAAAGVHRARGVTIVILPFDNFSGDARNDVAALATTEEIINRVGGVDPERIKVIDPLTAAKFKRANECIIHIGEALGAQYVMEGSLQKTHATAALYRVADNTQVWATAPRTDGAPALIASKVASTFRN